MKIKYSLSIILFLLTITIPGKGQTPGNFKLKSATDKSQFVLSKSNGKFVALHFLLKTECPNCLRHTRQYFSKAETLPNVIQVFIKPDDETEIKKWAEKLPADALKKFPIYRDPDAKLAARFKIPNGYLFHNQLVHYPAMILIGPNGKEVFRHTGKNNTDRYSFEQLAVKVRELTKK
ncbi:MAG TPA: redoxin domain-containing protein [Sphingobacteriaceae bacterium]|nr:redoxin domain-containing protein [Sphingobacteriaceae bacterium]